MSPLATPEITSNIQWIAQMNVDVEPTAGRKTTVIGTIGKKSTVKNVG
jgi:pyruvate kinase